MMIPFVIVPAGISVALLLIVLAWYQALRMGEQAGSGHAEEEPANHTAWPTVSVLIPAWSEEATLGFCLQALNQVDYPCWEAIIIAGGPDHTFEIAEQFTRQERFTLIRQGSGGKNAALNQGLSVATGDVIVILDADSVFHREWLRALVRPLLEGADASYGNYLPLKRTWVSKTEEMEKIASCLILKHYILQGSGSIALRREVLKQMGGFPQEVTTGVDWDLSIRLEAAGRKVHFAENALVWSYRPSTLSEFWKNEVRWRRAHLHSLLNQRRWCFRDRVTTIANGMIYGIIIALGVGILFVLISLLSGSIQIARISGLLLSLAVITLMVRKAALAGQVASYTRDRQWIYLSWAPAVLLLVTFAASWFALLTLNQQTVHFKGPRSGLALTRVDRVDR